MGLPANVRHVIFVIIVALSGTVTALRSAEPWMWLPAAASVLAVLGAVFTDAPGTAAKLAALRARLSPDDVRRGTSAIIAILFLGCLLRSTTACQPSQQVATDVTVGLNAAVCIVSTTLQDLAAGMNPGQVAVDDAEKCGVSLAQVAQVLDANAAALERGDGGSGPAFAMVSAAAKAKAAR